MHDQQTWSGERVRDGGIVGELPANRVEQSCHPHLIIMAEIIGGLVSVGATILPKILELINERTKWAVSMVFKLFH